MSRLVSAAVVAALLVGGLVNTAGLPDSPPRWTAGDSKAAAGMRVYLDAAGRPTLPDPDVGAVQPQAAFAARAGQEPELIDAPGGGQMVVTAGRLRHYSSAALDAQGRPRVACTGSTAAEPAANTR